MWPIYLLTAVSAAAGAFDLPARQALTPNLVPREHLPNAITLNSIMLQTASVGGPALGGLILATHGVGWVYTSNAVSFLFVIGALLMMDPPRHDETAAADRGNFTVAAALEGLRLRLPRAADPFDDAAGFPGDVLLVGNRAAADLRPGHPAGRRTRLRLALRRARRRLPPHERGRWFASSIGSSAAARC